MQEGEGMHENEDGADEVSLTGGFSTVVSRRGDTVRRTANRWTPTVHTLLRHLHAAGFGLAPQPLGYDEQGREVLTHLGGRVAWWPWPEPLRRDDGLLAVARMVTDLAEATASFRTPADAVWHDPPLGGPGQQIRHGDLGPWNTLWSEGRLTGLIDWDTAGPAPAGWDAAQAAWFFVPLRPMTGYRGERPTFGFDDQVHRFALWCRAVGVDPVTLLARVDAVQAFDRDRVLTRGAAGEEPYATFLARGDADEIASDRAWLAERREPLLVACAAGRDASPPV